MGLSVPTPTELLRDEHIEFAVDMQLKKRNVPLQTNFYSSGLSGIATPDGPVFFASPMGPDVLENLPLGPGLILGMLGGYIVCHSVRQRLAQVGDTNLLIPLPKRFKIALPLNRGALSGRPHWTGLVIEVDLVPDEITALQRIISDILPKLISHPAFLTPDYIANAEAMSDLGELQQDFIAILNVFRKMVQKMTLIYMDSASVPDPLPPELIRSFQRWTTPSNVKVIYQKVPTQLTRYSCGDATVLNILGLLLDGKVPSAPIGAQLRSHRAELISAIQAIQQKNPVAPPPSTPQEKDDLEGKKKVLPTVIPDIPNIPNVPNEHLDKTRPLKWAALDEPASQSDKKQFLEALKIVVTTLTNSEIVDLFHEFLDAESPYHFINEQKNPWWDEKRMTLFGRKNDFWHTNTLQKAVGILKRRFEKNLNNSKYNDIKDYSEDRVVQFVDFHRSNITSAEKETHLHSTLKSHGLM